MISIRMVLTCSWRSSFVLYSLYLNDFFGIVCLIILDGLCLFWFLVFDFWFLVFGFLGFVCFSKN